MFTEGDAASAVGKNCTLPTSSSISAGKSQLGARMSQDCEGENVMISS
jgi:hypothetical protein